jgi:hypothetical protein
MISVKTNDDWEAGESALKAPEVRHQTSEVREAKSRELKDRGWEMGDETPS